MIIKAHVVRRTFYLLMAKNPLKVNDDVHDANTLLISRCCFDARFKKALAFTRSDFLEVFNRCMEVM